MIVAELRKTLLGWKAYFDSAEVLSPLRDIDKGGTTQVTLLSLETMGIGRLPATAQTRRICARSMEHQ
jgi:hypothetical protein